MRSLSVAQRVHFRRPGVQTECQSPVHPQTALPSQATVFKHVLTRLRINVKNTRVHDHVNAIIPTLIVLNVLNTLTRVFAINVWMLSLLAVPTHS